MTEVRTQVKLNLNH